MKLEAEFERLNSGESNSRALHIGVEEEYRDKKIKIGFITPEGRVFITDEIPLENGEGKYVLPYELLDGKGMLLAQLIVYEGEEFIIKSRVYEFPVFRSVDDEDCPVVTSEGIRSLAFMYELLMKKSDIGHTHNEIYYTETEADNLLSEKSDKGHSHDERYYGKTETDMKLSEKSNKAHKHDDLYYTKNEADIIHNMKSDIDHRHNWYEIDNVPGTSGEVYISSYELDDLYRESNSRWEQFYENAPDITSGETVVVRVRPYGSDTEYEEECTVLSSDGYMLCISFNNSSVTDENIADGTYSYFPEAIRPYMPSLLLCIMPADSCVVYTAGDYEGAHIEITRRTYVKLPNSALDVTDEVVMGSDALVTSGAVYEAVSSAEKGNVNSVNSKTGNVVLTAADVGAESAGSCAKLLDSLKYYTDERLSEAAEEFPGSFVVNAVFDSSTMTMSGVTKSFTEISEAYAINKHIYLCVDMEGTFAFLELKSFCQGEFAVFEGIFSMDTPTHVSAIIFANRGSSVGFTPLATASALSEKSNTSHTHTYDEISGKPEVNGLMFRRVLTSADDLDNIFEDGVYVYSTSSLPGNAPFANAAVVEVFGSTSTTSQKIQRAYRYGMNGYSAFRVLYSGEWREWAVTCDSVIEQGSSGGWSYRKWFSGKMEAWGNVDASVTEISTNNQKISGLVVITAQVKFPTGMLSGEDNVEYCSLQARNYKILGNMSGISSNNLWGRFTTYTGVDADFPVGNTAFPVHAYLKGKWK